MIKWKKMKSQGQIFIEGSARNNSAAYMISESNEVGKPEGWVLASDGIVGIFGTIEECKALAQQIEDTRVDKELFVWKQQHLMGIVG
jgi:hypothetical protein